MDNIVTNLIDSILKSPITLLFLGIIIVYTFRVLSFNKGLYNHIDSLLQEIDLNPQNSKLYISTKDKYSRYNKIYPRSNIDITTFVEEIMSDYKYKDKYLIEQINTLKNTSSTCILIGVLGTFVGLSFMLMSVNTSSIIDSLPSVISSMQTAFTTSIFGIITSLIITILLKEKPCEHILIQLMLKLDNLLTLEKTNEQMKAQDDKIDDLKNTINNINETIKCLEYFEEMSIDLKEFNNTFIISINTLKKLLEGSEGSIKAFDQSVRKLDKQINIVNIKFSQLFDRYENQESINKDILEQINISTKSIKNNVDIQNNIKRYIKDMYSSFGIYERTIHDLINELKEKENKLDIQQSYINDNENKLESSINSLSYSIDSFIRDIDSKIELIFNYIEIYRDTVNFSMNKSPIVDEEIYEIDKEYSKKVLDSKNIYSLVHDISGEEYND